MDVVVVFGDQLIECALVGVGQWPLLVLAGALAEDGLGDGDYMGGGEGFHGGGDGNLGIKMGAVAGGFVLDDGALDGVEVYIDGRAAASGDVGGDEDIAVEVDHGVHRG